uniref:CDK5 regulatory subunit-associated protein 2/Myomegalin coiled coil domain-containing protein n=1 Tax=Seriola dumerili TaxID=41447 RepID=A0A3B4UWF5_SERDU
NEMECELRSLRQESQSQERTIQGLTESISTKDSEAQELYQMIEGQNTTLCKLKSLTLAQLQGELVGVQSSLFSLGLELEASQRSLRQSQRQGDDLVRFKDRLNSDLQEALQHREVTEKHNQDLRCALQKARSELQAKDAALKESDAEKHSVLQEKERSIAQLKRSLQDKEQQLQVIHTTLSKPRDALLEKLRERIKDRDRALEHSIDDKFRCLEDREGQVRRLQLALREKERDLERLRCILSNNEETITSLDSLVRGKELELEQAAEAYRNLQWLKQQSEEKERNTLREKDTIINQLQAALQSRSQETQDLTAALVARVQAGPTEVVEELKARLALKEKLFQELLSDRSRQSNEHQTQVQDLLSTLSSKDQYLQCVLEQLVSEYNKLNDALRAEKRLYQNLMQIHTKSDSSEKIQALHTELDSVQALRGQLEEVLARTRNMALVLDRAAKRQPDFGGGDGQGPASRAAVGTVTNAP